MSRPLARRPASPIGVVAAHCAVLPSELFLRQIVRSFARSLSPSLSCLGAYVWVYAGLCVPLARCAPPSIAHNLWQNVRLLLLERLFAAFFHLQPSSSCPILQVSLLRSSASRLLEATEKCST